MNWFMRLFQSLRRKPKMKNVPEAIMDRDWDSVKKLYQGEVSAFVRRQAEEPAEKKNAVVQTAKN